jgi:UDP-glucose 4-epimerase
MNNKSFLNQNILIVGGAGFVGSNLCLKLIEESPNKIIIVDNLLSSEASNIPKNEIVDFRHGSITDESILNGLPDNLDYVFHLSCYHGNQSSIANPIADHENNTFTTLKLFERLVNIKNLKKVVYAAAGCAVAEKTYSDARATTEDAPISLFHDSPYSISKIVGEFYGNYYYTSYGLPFVKARFQNVYGPREILGAGQWRGTPHTVWRNVTPTFIYKSLLGESLPLDNEGKVSRDFIFVEDMARGLMAAALNGEPGEAYNLASGVETTIKSLAETINEITKNTSPVELKPAREWDKSGCRYGSIVKSKEKLGFEASVPIREGLEKTISWMQNNIAVIETCMNRHDYFIQNYDGHL